MGEKKATSINFSQESAVTPASTRLMGTMEMGPAPTLASLLTREDFRPFWWVRSFCYDPAWSSLNPTTLTSVAYGEAMAAHSPLISNIKIPVSPKISQKKNEFHVRDAEKPPKNMKSPS